MSDQAADVIEPTQAPKRALEADQSHHAALPEDPAATQVEKLESNGTQQEHSGEPSAKRVKYAELEPGLIKVDGRDKVKGIALVKAE